MSARYTETSNVFVMRNEGVEKLLIAGDPADIPPMSLTDVHHHIGSTMRCPNANDEQCRYPACACHAARTPAPQPAPLGWRVCNAFCLCLFAVLVALIFSPISRSFLRAFVQLVIG